MKIRATKDFKENIVKTEIEMDVPEQYTQIYEILSPLVYRLRRPISFHFLHWIIANMDRENIMVIGSIEKKEFCRIILESGGPEYKPGSVQKAIEELVENNIIERVSNGRYKMNVYLAWKDAVKKRYDQIKQQLQNGNYPIGLPGLEPKNVKRIDND